MTAYLTSSLQAIVEGHGITTNISATGDIFLNGGFTLSPIVVSSLDKPDGKLIQLDVHVKSPLLGDRLLIESFAGYGPDSSRAVLQALDKFCRSSLHVLLATFLDEEPCSDQVEWE